MDDALDCSEIAAIGEAGAARFHEITERYEIS
jgi:hypothetical protein